MNFNEFHYSNVARSNDVLKFYGDSTNWTLADWACAAIGELGEACNKIKKIRRGQEIPIDSVMDELADTFIYMDLLAGFLGKNFEEALIRKFNEVSDRVGSSVYL